MTSGSNTWVATKKIAEALRKKLKRKGWNVRVSKSSGGGYLVSWWK